MIAILIAAAIYCGVERTDVKDLQDAASRQMQPADRVVTVAELTALPAQKWQDHAPRSSVERQIATVKADIVAYKIEDDNDIHVVLSDGQRTLIIEFPHPDCAGKGHVAQFAAARRELLTALLKKPGKRTVKLGTGMTIPVKVTGVIFFDKIHGQLGVAHNGVEIHPVLKIERLP